MSLGPTEHLIVHEPSHAARAIDRLLQQHRGKPRWEAFLRACACAVQAHENASFAAIATATVLEVAPTDALRKWGTVIGEPQGGLTKAEYLQILLQRIVTNSAGRVGGTRDRGWVSFTQFLIDVFAPGTVQVVNETSVIKVNVVSATLGTLGVRAGAMVGLWRPLGALIVVRETVETTGFRYGAAGPGYGATYGRRTLNGG